MKTSTTLALALAMALSGSLAAYAQTEQPIVHHHYHHYAPHHTVHHHYVAHGPAVAPVEAPIVTTPPPEAAQNVQPSQMFKPYAEPGEGDDDGLSRDPDDCMKGCIGGAPQ